jgi:hypothetical protein
MHGSNECDNLIAHNLTHHVFRSGSDDGAMDGWIDMNSELGDFSSALVMCTLRFHPAGRARLGSHGHAAYALLCPQPLLLGPLSPHAKGALSNLFWALPSFHNERNRQYRLKDFHNEDLCLIMTHASL